MKKATFKERFSYWFDNKMSGGSLSLIKLLAVVSIGIVIVIAVLIFLLGLSEDGGFLSALWNSLATVINAWMPFYEDGGPGYLLFMAAASVVGLLVTSILIGIIASAIEEKVNDLKRGTSRVLEEGHFVVLGFYPGEYTLLRQLALAAGGEPRCIVVAGEMEQEEMEQYVRDNIDVPGNVRILCRTVDLFDPCALERCAVSSCRTVIISPTDDFRTAKALLAVSAIINGEGGARVCAVVSKLAYVFPPSIAEKHHITTLQTHETIARIIAHSCTQPGLADTFREVFNFEGSELYAKQFPDADGRLFADVLLRMDGGVPIGVARNGTVRINPPSDMVIEAGDSILFFAASREAPYLTEAAALPPVQPVTVQVSGGSEGTIAVIGANESLSIILRELPENISHVILADGGRGYRDEAEGIAEERGSFLLSFYDEEAPQSTMLMDLAKRASSIVVLSDHEKDDDDADMESIFLLMNLRDIRTRCGLTYNITSEMCREANHSLMITDDNTDFVVASDMASLILAQMAESPELFSVFGELLSNEGNELYLKKAGRLGCSGEKTVAEIRRTALAQGYIVIGCKDVRNRSSFNPRLGDVIRLREDDSLIVIGQD